MGAVVSPQQLLSAALSSLHFCPAPALALSWAADFQDEPASQWYLPWAAGEFLLLLMELLLPSFFHLGVCMTVPHTFFPHSSVQHFALS